MPLLVLHHHKPAAAHRPFAKRRRIALVAAGLEISLHDVKCQGLVGFGDEGSQVLFMPGGLLECLIMVEARCQSFLCFESPGRLHAIQLSG